MSYATYDLTLKRIFETSVSRAKRWHPGGIEEWSALEWAGAMCGEAGEAANAAKKLRRIELSMQNIDKRAMPLTTEAEAKLLVAQEACDTILYAILLLARVGIIDPEQILCDVFDSKSEEYGFPERLGPPKLTNAFPPKDIIVRL